MIKIILRRTLPPLIILLIFILVAWKLVSNEKNQQQKERQPAIPHVEVTTVKPKTITLKLSSYGIVNPKHKTELVTEVSGRLQEISDKFVAGGMVKRGDKLAEIESSNYRADLIQAQAKLAAAKAALDEELARNKVAKNNWKDYHKGIPPKLGLRLPQLEKEQANVKFARAAQARAKRYLAKTIIKAPFDGIIKARNIDLGQYVNIGTNLGELYDTDSAEIRLPLSNNKLAYLESVDHPNTGVTLNAQLGGKTINWVGKITRSEGVIDTKNRMVYLVAEIKDPYLRKHKNSGQLPLKYGSFVSAIIKGRTVHNIVKLPRYMVRNNKVAVVKTNNTIEIRGVNVVRSDINDVYIKGGLHDGERIASSGNTNLTMGEKVKVIDQSDGNDKITTSTAVVAIDAD